MIWAGYPHSVSVLQFSGITRHLDHDGISTYDLVCDYEIVEGCSGVYLKWLALGAYQYWLFNPQYKDSYSVKGIGDTVNNFDDMATAISRVDSRGVTVQPTKRITTKIDSSYMPHLLGLISSPEIYLYTGAQYSGDNSWLKVKLKDGNFDGVDSKNNSIDFKATIEMPELYTVMR